MWLCGAISNFYGLKRTLKREHFDFRKLRGIPNIIVLFYLNKSDLLIKEIYKLKIPKIGFCDSSMDPYFFNYFIPSNIKSKEGLFFF